MKTPATSGGAAAAAAAWNQGGEGERKMINPELWYACAGPLVSLPPVGSLVVYFPQGHSEQVAASMQKDIDADIPNYPNLPPKLICRLHNLTLHADPDTDEVYAQMTLQPVSTYDKDALLASDFALKQTRPQTEFFCKTLTASDTSTHGGFSVPRRAAEKIFPPLDFTMQPPAQELQARDLHDNLWTFRHIYRAKKTSIDNWVELVCKWEKTFAGDSVLFIRDEKQQLLLGIRRANRQPTNMPSSVLSSDSMHIGILAAAAHAAANNSPFTVFYNPRYMGTITGINDLDPVRWKNSPWRNLQVGWDESAAGERRSRVSIWEIEPVAAPFFICPPPFFRSKRPRQPGMPDDESSEMENLFKRAMPWLGEEICIKDPQTQNTVMPGLSLVEWMSMQQNPALSGSRMQTDHLRSLAGPVFQNFGASDISKQLGLQSQVLQQNNIQCSTSKVQQPAERVEQLPKTSVELNQLNAASMQPQQQRAINLQQRQQLVGQAIPMSEAQKNLVQPQVLLQSQNQNLQAAQTNQPVPSNLQASQAPQQQLLLKQQQQLQQLQQLRQQQQLSRIPAQVPNLASQQMQLSEHQLQMQLLQKFQLQQQLQQQLQKPTNVPQPVQQQPQFLQLQEQQRIPPAEATMVPNSCPLPQQNLIASPRINPSQVLVAQSSQLPVQQKLQQHQQQTQLAELPGAARRAASQVIPSNLHCSNSESLLGTGTQSIVTDEIPSCSTSPSMNNASVLQHSILNRTQHTGMMTADKICQQGGAVVNPCNFDTAGGCVAKELPKSEPNAKLPTSKMQAQGLLAPQTYLNNVPHADYLDTSSSATSVCLSQTDGQLQQNFPLTSFNHPSMFSDVTLDGEVNGVDLRNNVLFGVNIDEPLAIPLTDSLLATNIDSTKYQNRIAGNMVGNYSASKDNQQDMSSSIVSQSIGVPDVVFNSMDSNINGNGLLNRSSWAPAPQSQPLRTYTKVYKRGAVGRSIDITRYSGYDELRHDLARMFSIEGQLQDGQRIAWKLVYVDHEDDVLLVGDDPWEEFVSCVKYIKILSPQEVQQMSLEGDIGNNNILLNQACSSSDGGMHGGVTVIRTPTTLRLGHMST